MSQVGKGRDWTTHHHLVNVPHLVGGDKKKRRVSSHFLGTLYIGGATVQYGCATWADGKVPTAVASDDNELTNPLPSSPLLTGKWWSWGRKIVGK